MSSISSIIALFIVVSVALTYSTAYGRLFNGLRPYGNDDGLNMVYYGEMPVKRSRCLINAGLSQGCDLSDILYSNRQASKLASFAGPGRR